MSLIPFVLNDYLYNNWPRLSRSLDRQLDVLSSHDDDDILSALTVLPVRNLRVNKLLRPWHTDKIDHQSKIQVDKDKFQISLDVQQFSPEEITVKTIDDNCVVVEGKHDERKDEHGYVSREFTRRIILPRGHDIKQLASKLSSDGVLTITAPKINTRSTTERVIPITHTGPVKRKSVEESSSDGDQEKTKKKAKR